MFRTRPHSLVKAWSTIQRSCPTPNSGLRKFSHSSPSLNLIPVQISGQGTGFVQTVSVQGKQFKFSTDAYTVLGGNESHPSPIAYSLASLSSCNQVTGSLVAKDLGITIGEWNVSVEGKLPTATFVGGEEGNPNWNSVSLVARVQTNLKGGNDHPQFQRLVAEVERRCPMTALFKNSGVAYTSDWTNESYVSVAITSRCFRRWTTYISMYSWHMYCFYVNWLSTCIGLLNVRCQICEEIIADTRVGTRSSMHQGSRIRTYHT